MAKKDGIVVKGHTGTWYVADSVTIDNKLYMLLESEQYGEDADWIAVNDEYKLVMSNIRNGADDLIDYLQDKKDDEQAE